MNLRILTTATLLTLTTAAFAGDTFDRTLNVNGPADLYVSTGSGNVRIHPGTDNQIHVIGHVHAGWSAFGDVNSRVQRIVDAPPITQSGNSIRVGESNDHTLFSNISIDYEINVPASVALNLHSGSGDVEIDHVARYLSASSGSGSVRAHGIHGPADLQSGSGDLELQQEGAGDVKAKTGSGSIRINGLNGGLSAKTGSTSSRTPTSTSKPPPAPAPSASTIPAPPSRATTPATTSPPPSTAAAPPSKSAPAPATSKSTAATTKRSQGHVPLN
jgi:hypothetical protein